MSAYRAPLATVSERDSASSHSSTPSMNGTSNGNKIYNYSTNTNNTNGLSNPTSPPLPPPRRAPPIKPSAGNSNPSSLSVGNPLPNSLYVNTNGTSNSIGKSTTDLSIYKSMEISSFPQSSSLSSPQSTCTNCFIPQNLVFSFCLSCSQSLCSLCDQFIHSVGSLSSHHRQIIFPHNEISLSSSSSSPPLCGKCHFISTLYCNDCQSPYCEVCALLLHATGKRRDHYILMGNSPLLPNQTVIALPTHSSSQSNNNINNTANALTPRNNGRTSPTSPGGSPRLAPSNASSPPSFLSYTEFSPSVVHSLEYSSLISIQQETESPTSFSTFPALLQHLQVNHMDTNANTHPTAFSLQDDQNGASPPSIPLLPFGFHFPSLFRLSIQVDSTVDAGYSDELWFPSSNIIRPTKDFVFVEGFLSPLLQTYQHQNLTSLSFESTQAEDFLIEWTHSEIDLLSQLDHLKHLSFKKQTIFFTKNLWQNFTSLTSLHIVEFPSELHDTCEYQLLSCSLSSKYIPPLLTHLVLDMNVGTYDDNSAFILRLHHKVITHLSVHSYSPHLPLHYHHLEVLQITKPFEINEDFYDIIDCISEYLKDSLRIFVIQLDMDKEPVFYKMNMEDLTRSDIDDEERIRRIQDGGIDIEEYVRARSDSALDPHQYELHYDSCRVYYRDVLIRILSSLCKLHHLRAIQLDHHKFVYHAYFMNYCYFHPCSADLPSLPLYRFRSKESRKMCLKEGYVNDPLHIIHRKEWDDKEWKEREKEERDRGMTVGVGDEDENVEENDKWTMGQGEMMMGQSNGNGHANGNANGYNYNDDNVSSNRKGKGKSPSREGTGNANGFQMNGNGKH